MSTVAPQITGVTGCSKLRVRGPCEEYPPETGGFPSQGPVIRKMFQFNDVIMLWTNFSDICINMQAFWKKISLNMI